MDEMDEQERRSAQESPVQEPTTQESPVQEPTVQEPTVQESPVQEPAVQEPAAPQPYAPQASYGYGYSSAQGAAQTADEMYRGLYAQGGRPRRSFWVVPLCITAVLLALTLAVLLLAWAGGTAYQTVVRDAVAEVLPAEEPVAGTLPEGYEGFVITELPEELDNGLSTAEIAKKVSPSVVCINVFASYSIEAVGSGSGIVMNDAGYIITNAHVVEGASALTVQLDDGREFPGRVVGADTKTDLAVIKITADGLSPAEFGDSATLQVGERAIAIGNAAGEFSGSVTQGIISGLNREVTLASGNQRITMNLIQTDAAINPGNSGGALVNRYGQVIGINSSKLASVDYEGIGFAIPITEAQPVLDSLVANGRVTGRAVLGISVIALNEVNGAASGLPARGLYISALEDYSPLVQFDITVGDVILSADGTETVETKDLTDLLKDRKPGDTISLQIRKKGSGNVITVDAALVESPN